MAAVAAHDDRHDGVPAPHPGDHVKSDVVFPGQREVAGRDIAKGDVRSGLGDAGPQCGVDADDAKDAVALGDDDVAHADAMIGPAQETRSRPSSAGTIRKSRSMTSFALRTRNMLAWSAFGIACPRRDQL